MQLHQVVICFVTVSNTICPSYNTVEILGKGSKQEVNANLMHS